ncbi:hypothetical protein CL629_01900 [bacterium]|nr:hypothetical protein [bacterium]|tara:strand:+ start:2001 stop:2504 length:504 start_codon:yes stop_codon:yes gene_type:complete
MPTFQVPQFIEQKSKIVGPLTLKQFLYIGGAAAISLISYYTFTYFLWVIISLVVGAAAIAFAFVKINGREFSHVITAGFGYIWKPKTYTWKREVVKDQTIDTSSLEKLQAARKQAQLQEKMNSLKTFVLTKASRTRHHIKGEQKKDQQYETVKYLTGEEEKAKKVDY